MPHRPAARRRPPRRPAVARPPIFSLDDPDGRGYIPDADRFPPDVSRAEATRVLAVRAGFLAALLADPRVVAVFTHWQDDANAFAKSWRPGSRRPAPPLHVDRLLRELALPAAWRPWVGAGLLHTFHRWLSGRLDESGGAVIPPGEVAVLAPPSLWLFAIEDGDSTDDARERLREMVADIETALTAAEPVSRARARRAPRGDAAFLWDWGAWLFDTRYRRPRRTITAIARTTHTIKGHPQTFETHDCRKPIRAGLTAAVRLLTLATRR